MPLAIVNREPSDHPPAPGALIWRTCLREVAFSDEFALHEETPATSGLRLAEGAAYRLLLEILCGLQSPMLGETQVMGQFKAFLSSLGAEQAWLTRLGQRLLADARDVRTRHLQGLGSRSYGSAVRRFLGGCDHAAIIGTGKLADEVLPFLNDECRSVDQWGRSDLDDVDARPVVSGATVLIIAAPIRSELADRVAARYSSLECVIDLRGEMGCSPLDVRAPIVTLQDLFAQMSAANVFASRHVEAARAEIADRSRRYELRDELRPFGWDDLCA